MHLESAHAHPWGIENMSFGERVRTLRTKKGLSAKDLSARSGVPEKAIYRIETGEVKDPGISTVEKLVKALSCTADEILFDVDSLGSNERLQRLLLETSNTSRGNQELVIHVVTRLNMADNLQHEVYRHEVDNWLSDGGTSLESMADTVGMEKETYEYFKKHPSPDRTEENAE